jgi:hypothetical protein
MRGYDADTRGGYQSGTFSRDPAYRRGRWFCRRGPSGGSVLPAAGRCDRFVISPGSSRVEMKRSACRRRRPWCRYPPLGEARVNAPVVSPTRSREEVDVVLVLIAGRDGCVRQLAVVRCADRHRRPESDVHSRPRYHVVRVMPLAATLSSPRRTLHRTARRHAEPANR